MRIQELQRDDDTGVVTLKLTPVHGDTLYYEVGAPATSASAPVSDVKRFETGELQVSFLCVDAQGEHETGEPVPWGNRITIKSRTYQSASDKMVELRAAPTAPLRYTTDGSDPKISGATYDGPFVVPPGARVVLAVAEKHGRMTEHRLDIDWQNQQTFTLDQQRPAIWKRDHTLKTTKESYEFLGRLQKHQVTVPGLRISIVGPQHWLELTCDDKLSLPADKLEGVINHLRGVLNEGEIELDARRLAFPTGQHLLDWVEAVRTEIQPEEVEQ